jgi:hypothetical protein
VKRRFECYISKPCLKCNQKATEGRLCAQCADELEEQIERLRACLKSLQKWKEPYLVERIRLLTRQIAARRAPSAPCRSTEGMRELRGLPAGSLAGYRAEEARQFWEWLEEWRRGRGSTAVYKRAW